MACDCSNGDSQLFIFKEYDNDNNTVCFLFLDTDGTLDIDEFDWRTDRLATEEEKQKIFDAIKANGYKWNQETKTLEKLHKFKVGDKIRHKKNTTIIKTIGHIYSDGYALYDGHLLYFKEQDEWELVPNKFDTNILKPFESKVLVRNVKGDLWKPAAYGFSYSKGCYVVGGIYWKQCIPYKGNEYLLGKTDDCNDYYKTWENESD